MLNQFSRFTVLFVVLSWSVLTSAAPMASVNDIAPPFSAELVTGDKVELEQYRGRTLLLTFWATWCSPCLRELPEIEEAYRLFKKQGLDVLAVNFAEDSSTITAYVNKHKLALPVAIDEELVIANTYGVFALPKSFFINPEGVITKIIIGGTLTTESIGEILHQYTP
ncbi:hypothetical protein MNBD_GAMMA16-1920 [hydrothermal vent metagenome]|uniref:Thioredoxin domain-containing protein n=1 Tax=hydrothermal vent metagenome TaxID=652676 RepID=A0A3B0Z914_9ZZZZ